MSMVATSGFSQEAADGEESATSGRTVPSGRSRRSSRSLDGRGVSATARGSSGRIDDERRARPEPALDRDPAAVHVDDRLDDRQAEPAAAAARLVGQRPAEEPLEDPGQLGRVDPDARVADHDPRHRPGPARSSTSTDPPRGVNLSALPTRLLTTWPIRCGSWRIRTGFGGRLQPERHAAPLARRLGLLDRRLDRRPQVVRPEVEQDQPGVELRQLEQVLGEPVEALDLLAARLEELGPRVGIVAGRSMSSSLNVRRAAIGVRSSWDTSARKSRLRSRSRRMISTLSWSRSAIALNWRRQLANLARRSPPASVGTRLRGRPREIAGRLGQPAERGREAAGQERRHGDRHDERDDRDDEQQAVTSRACSP